MKARSALVTVSGDTVRAKAGKHLRVAVETFAQVQAMLDDGEVTGLDRHGRYGVWLAINGVLHKLGLKLSKDGFMYVSTLFESGPSKLGRERIRKR